MQYELQIFQYETDFQFRTMDINGENWFVLADACRALDIKNPSDAARRLDDDEKGIAPADTLPHPQEPVSLIASRLDLALVSGVIVALQGKNHFGQMVDGENQLRIFAVVALLIFANREQAHGGAIVDPGL